MIKTSKILIVDDEQRMCDSLKTLLCSRNYEIQTCSSGNDALNHLRKEEFDLILLDILMEEMDGFQVIEKIINQKIDIPVIIMTGKASIESVVKALRMGASDYLKKPFEHEELCLSVKNVLSQRILKKENESLTKKLNKSEKKYRLLIENQTDLVVRVDLEGKFQFVSPSYCEMFGKTEEELIGNTFMPLVHKDDRENTAKKMEALYNPPHTAYLEQRAMTKDGWKWLSWMDTAVLDEKKKIISIIGVGRDITERKKVEEINKALFSVSNAVNTTQNLKDLFKSIHHSIGSIIDVSNFFIAMMDIKKRTLHSPYHVDTTDDDFSPITNFDQNNSLTGLVVSQRRPILMKKKELKKRAEKQGIWGHVPLIWMGVPLIIKDEVIGVVAVQSYSDENLYNEQDLTLLSMVSDQMSLAIHRKRAEELLRESEEKLKSAFEGSHDAIMLTRKDGRVLDCNQRALELYGLESKEDFGDMRPADFSPPFQPDGRNSQKASQELINKVLKKGNFLQFEWVIQRKTGETIPTEIIITTTKIDGKSVVQSSIRDITDRKQAEKEKIESQQIIAEQNKLALVGKIAGKMAHDFNNILGIVMGNAELALLDCKDPETRETLELIFQQTLRGKNLTRNLVVFAKDQEPKQQFFSANEKIELVLNLLKKDLEEIDAIKKEGHGIPDLLADPGMIEHTLVNLVQNSIHATSMVEHPRIIIRTFHKNENIYIAIEDNGCGIPAEVLDKIYEPAFTMKGRMDITNSYKAGIKGTGYGMANVKKYIEQHKGNITIESKVWKGTKVTISLPVMEKELTKKEITEIQKENFYFEKHILLVEDEQAISDVQYKILTHEPCNHKVDVAATGEMAVDLFDRNKYDFVSLDYILPGELNGMDVYKHIRQTNDTIPILFVSGNLDFLESIKELKHKDHCIDHVSKPCKNKDYVNAINELL